MMQESRGREFLATLSERCQDLPFSPLILQDLFKATDASSMASLEDVASIISRDQGLSARLLALANSAFYGLQSQVTSISRAAALLGVKEIRNLALLTGVKAMTEKHLPPDDFHLKDYWSHNLKVAVIAMDLDESCGFQEPQIVYTAGMLHDLGKLLTALYAPEDWSAIQELMEREGEPSHRAENAYWALEHGVVGSMALAAWNLPRELSEPVNWHHSPHLAKDLAKEAGLINLADLLSYHVSDEDQAVSEALETALAPMAEEHEMLKDLEGYCDHLRERLTKEDVERMACSLA